MKTIALNKFKALLSVFLVFAVLSSSTLWTGASTVTIKTQSVANNLLSDGAHKGIDVSHWQGDINWSKVSGDGIKFAFIRASFGLEADTHFVENAKAAHKNGVKVGAYHYAKFKDRESMKKEAEYFISLLKKVNITYPVVLDIESNRGLNRSELTLLCKEFMDILEANGYKTMLYSYSNFINDNINLSGLGGRELWIANYLEYPSNISHSVWQHTSYGSVNGVKGRVDINIGHKDLSIRKDPITVDSEKSKNMISYLNSTYGASMDPKQTTIDMQSINYWTAYGIQKELAQHFDSSIIPNGKLSDEEIDIMIAQSIHNPNYSKIVNLLQIKLFYVGCYNFKLSGAYDTNMYDGLLIYQSNRGLSQTGFPSRDTLQYMFGVKV